MSHIPNSAMPHAGPVAEAETDTNTEASGTASRLFTQFTDTIREHPKTAIAAGAAVAAGVAGVAAATVIGRGRATTGKSAGKAKKS
jgi:hypothetical protein